MPRGAAPGVRWVAELIDLESKLPFPLAVTWLSDFRANPHFPFMLLDYVQVPDHLRRHSYASELIRRCRGRWPELELTDAISEAGEGLLESLDRNRTLLIPEDKP